ncbi:MAG: hypothetical protein ACRDY1_16515 [Acidimicrobiales bacterium]
MIEPEVVIVLEAAPDFAGRYRQLLEAADDDPGAAVVFAELAEFVASLAAEMDRLRPGLERCLAAVEAVAEQSEDAEDLVVWSFFDNLSPDDIGRLGPWLGPATRRLLDDADQVDGEKHQVNEQK